MSGSLQNHWPVAQLAEHRIFDPGVVGSMPTGPTSLLIKNKKNVFLYSFKHHSDFPFSFGAFRTGTDVLFESSECW